MAPRRAFLFLTLLAALTINGSGTVGGVTGFGRAVPTASATRTANSTPDRVLPFEGRPDVGGVVKRQEREPSGHNPSAAVNAVTGVGAGRGRGGFTRGGTAFLATTSLASGSRAPPATLSFFLR